MKKILAGILIFSFVIGLFPTEVFAASRGSSQSSAPSQPPTEIPSQPATESSPSDPGTAVNPSQRPTTTTRSEESPVPSVTTTRDERIEPPPANEPIPQDRAMSLSEAEYESQQKLMQSGQDPAPASAPPPPVNQDAKMPAPKVFTINTQEIIKQSFVNLFTGASTIGLPLQVPSGRNNLTPNLALSYTSQLVDHNGPYAFGWDMQMGQIKRLNKLGIAEMYNNPAYYLTLSDGFQGELVKISENTDTEIYALRREESFSKIFHDKTSDSWELRTKDGMKFAFGSTTQSRVMNESGDLTYAWNLERVTDMNNNRIDYTYARLNNALYPKTIQYGGDNTATDPFTIKFQPFADNENPEWNRSDVKNEYTTGFSITYAHRVEAIEVYFQNQKKLTYDLQYVDREYKVRSELRALQITGTNPDNTTVSQKTTFKYYDLEDGFSIEDLTQQHKLLQKIEFHQGGEYQFHYMSSMKFFDGQGNIANKTPYPLIVVDALTQKHGTTSHTTNYSYSDGFFYFDAPDEREMAGFGRVTVTDPEDQKSTYYFHQAGGFEGAALGENQIDNWSLIGKMYRTELYDKAGSLVQRSINMWLYQKIGEKHHFVYGDHATSTLFSGAQQYSTATATQYDATNGNVIQGTAFGTVTASDNGTFSDTGSDKRTTKVSYAQNVASHLLAFEKSREFYDNSNTLVSQSKTYYDGLAAGDIEKGNITKQSATLLEESRDISVQYAYNTYGQLTTSTDPLGRVTKITYDTLSLYPASITNALDQQTLFSYDLVFGGLKRVTDANGTISETIYDGLGRSTQQAISATDDAKNLQTIAKTTYQDTAYPNSVDVMAVQDDGSFAHQITYMDGFARPIQQRVQGETASQFILKDISYDALGQQDKESLPYFGTGIFFTQPTTNAALWVVTTFDRLGRPLTVKNAVGTSKNSYAGWTITTTDADGKKKDLVYDAFQQLTAVNEYSAGTKYTTQYQYTPVGQLSRITDSKGNIRNFTYDSLGRLKKQDDLHAPSDSTFSVWNYSYNDMNSLINVTKPTGEVVQYTYDALNRMIAEDYTGAEGIEIQSTYDTVEHGIGKLAQVKKENFEVSYTYDRRGNAVTEKKVLDGKTYLASYTYDLQNRVKQSTLPDGSIVKNVYALSGTVDKIQKKEAGDAAFSDLIKNYDYSPVGQPAKIEYGNGAVVINEHDANQLYRTVKKTGSSKGKKVQEIAYTFDPVGNITKVVDTSEGKVTVSDEQLLPRGDVNGDGLINVVDTQCTIITSLWVAGGKTGEIPQCLKELKVENADVDCNNTVNVIDVQAVIHLALNKGLPVEVDTDGDNIHNACESLFQTTVEQTYGLAKVATYEYDDLHRLTKTTITGAVTGGDYQQTFAYDALGNMTYNSVVGTMTYGETADSPFANPHAMTSVKQEDVVTRTLKYDKNGNLVADGMRAMEWAYNDRMTKVTVGGAEGGEGAPEPQVTTFQYDPSGSRIKKNDDLYLWSDYEVEAGGKIIKNIGEVTIETVPEGDGSAGTPGISHYYDLRDHLSSASVLLDQQGEIAQMLDYFPYGSTRLQKSFGDFDKKRKFTGHELDDETGLYYAQARYYDPEIGRFISLDPAAFSQVGKFLTDPQQLNFYAYARNNPMRYVDPSGTVIEPTDVIVLGCGPGAGVCLILKEGGELVLLYGTIKLIEFIQKNITPTEIEPETVVDPPPYVDENGSCILIPPKVEAPPQTVDVPPKVEDNTACGGTATCAEKEDDTKTNPNTTKDPVTEKWITPLENPTQPPGEGWEWHGDGPVGSGQGSWYNPKTGESLYPDLKHPAPEGPHWDYKIRGNDTKYRVPPGGGYPEAK